jgi:hypothetical protein
VQKRADANIVVGARSAADPLPGLKIARVRVFQRDHALGGICTSAKRRLRVEQSLEEATLTTAVRIKAEGTTSERFSSRLGDTIVTETVERPSSPACSLDRSWRAFSRVNKYVRCKKTTPLKIKHVPGVPGKAKIFKKIEKKNQQQRNESKTTRLSNVAASAFHPVLASRQPCAHSSMVVPCCASSPVGPGLGTP